VKKQGEKRKQRRSFDHLGLDDDILQAVRQAEYELPTPVQAGLIPNILAGHDMIGQARTGTGKTAAFVLPILQSLSPTSRPKSPQGLVLVPTRELAVQVLDEFLKLRTDKRLSCQAIYGGKPMGPQIKQLQSGVDVVVGTPGRVLDHLRRKTLQADQVAWLVLDEADRMLDIGFRQDIERILSWCPRRRQTLLLSATLPDSILQLAKRYMNKPKLIDFSTKSLASETIEQHYFAVAEKDKYTLLLKLLERDKPRQAIVFCRTKLGTQRLYRKLLKDLDEGQAGTIHGDMQQNQRDRVMKAFRQSELQFLIATDVVGRGIDVSDISHIINYDIPQFSDDYVHRVGRTGRMGRQGVAFTLVTPMERSQLLAIEQRIDKRLIKDEVEGIDSPEIRPVRSKTRYRQAL